METADLDPAFADELTSTCRTAVGDELRSVTFFTREGVTQVYLREDLERTADLVGFAEHERLGFRSQEAYRNSQLGDYRATVRMFENGFMTRVIHDDVGAWVTTDDMSIDRFEELVTALKAVLAEIAAAEDEGRADEEAAESEEGGESEEGSESGGEKERGDKWEDEDEGDGG